MQSEIIKNEAFVSHSIRSEHEKDLKMTKLKLDYAVPITSSCDSPIESGASKFLIQGPAINAVLTRNGVKFTEEELKISATSLCNKPLLKDHNNSVDSIVGKTTGNVFYNAISKCVMFEAEVMDEVCRSKIKAGLITAVSVGCMVSELIEEEDCVVAKGIEFVELSLVAVPADPNAGIQTAISCSLQDKNKATVISKPEKVEEKIEINMEATNEKQTVDAKVETKLDFSADVRALTEELKTLKAELSAMKEVKVKVEEKVESKGIVANVQEKASTSDFDNYELTRENGFSAFSCKTYTHPVFKRGN